MNENEQIRAEIAALMDTFKAQDLILRELLSAIIGLGWATNAWDAATANDACLKLKERITATAMKYEGGTVLRSVLLSFCDHAAKCVPHIH